MHITFFCMWLIYKEFLHFIRYEVPNIITTFWFLIVLVQFRPQITSVLIKTHKSLDFLKFAWNYISCFIWFFLVVYVLSIISVDYYDKIYLNDLLSEFKDDLNKRIENNKRNNEDDNSNFNSLLKEIEDIRHNSTSILGILKLLQLLMIFIFCFIVIAIFWVSIQAIK